MVLAFGLCRRSWPTFNFSYVPRLLSHAFPRTHQPSLLDAESRYFISLGMHSEKQPLVTDVSSSLVGQT